MFELIIFNITLIPTEIYHKKILFSALNWGSGHVARSISLIDQLIERNNEVIIACDESQQRIYCEYFDNILFIDFTGYPFKFKGKGKFILDLVLNYNSLNTRLKEEFKEVKSLVEQYNIDLVISDHRYGFRSESVPSVFVTHQLSLPVKWYHFGVNRWHRNLIKRFNEIWVMDTIDNKLAGKLSLNQYGYNTSYIGVYSRFQRYQLPAEKTGGTVLIASGPTIYAQQLVDQFIRKEPILTVICSNEVHFDDATNYRKSTTWLEHDQLILNAEKIISRSGYSTIMDLEFLGVDSELIPTSGQYEQVYLADRNNNGN